MIIALGVGAFSIYYGLLTYMDWQWLNEHFGQGGSTRWSQGVIAGFFTRAVLLFAVGGLGLATFLLGFTKVRKALDEDNHDAIKRWSLLTGMIAVLPGVALSGLLELFIWRAHASEKFTIFGLLGKAPEPAGPPPSAMAIAAQQAEVDEAKRKQEYMALFGPSQPSRPMASNPQTMASNYAADSGYGYAPEPQYAPQQGYAPAEAAPIPEEAAPAYVDQPSGAPICTCGRPMEFIPEYGRYYCYTDDRYEGEA